MLQCHKTRSRPILWHFNIYTPSLIYIQPEDGFLQAETCC